jgi:O-antigen/teichoic acid export membrane protein
MSFRRDVVTTLLSRGVVLGVGLIQSVIVARALQPVGRGQYAILFLIPSFVLIIVPLGLQWSLVYFLRQGDRPRERLLRTGLGLGLLLGLTGFLTTLLAQLWVRDSFLAGLTLLAIVVSSATLFPRVLLVCWQGAFRGLNRIFHANLAAAVQPLVLFGLICIALLGLRAGVLGVAIAVLAAELLGALWIGLLVFRGRPPAPIVDRTLAGPLLGYGIRLYAFSVLLFFNYRIDQALLRHLTDYQQVGYYATAVALAEILWNVPQSFGFVLFPEVVGVSPEERNRKTTAVCRVTVGLMALICLLLAILARPLIRFLYGESFLPAAGPLWAILPGILAMSVQQVLGPDLSARNRPEAITLAAGLGLVVNVLLNLWWIPLWGSVGAALSSSVSYTLVGGVCLVAFLKASGQSCAATLLLNREDVRAAMLQFRRIRGT